MSLMHHLGRRNSNHIPAVTTARHETAHAANRPESLPARLVILDGRRRIDRCADHPVACRPGPQKTPGCSGLEPVRQHGPCGDVSQLVQAVSLHAMLGPEHGVDETIGLKAEVGGSTPPLTTRSVGALTWVNATLAPSQAGMASDPPGPPVTVTRQPCRTRIARLSLIQSGFSHGG